MREKLSLPIGIRGPSGSAKAPPAARSDNVLRKMRRAAHTEQGRTARAGIARRAGKINPRALRGGRERSTRGHCAAGGKNQPAGIARRAGKINPRALRGGRERSTHGRCAEKRCRAPPPCRNSLLALPCPASRLHRPMPIPPKRLAPTFPQAARSFPPLAACPGAQKKRSRSSVFLLSVYSLEPVSISEPMIIFWKIANRMMTGRTHMTAAAMTGPWF